MSRDLDVVTLTGAEYDALTQRADDWYALYARAAKERAAALEDVERWKRAAESNIEENVGLRLAEEGAKEAFGHVVQQKRDLEAECTRLRGLLDGAYDTIRRQAVPPNVEFRRGEALACNAGLGAERPGKD